MRRVADDRRGQSGRAGAATPPAPAHIDLGLDTTFIRSTAKAGSRHHEILIGHACCDQGRQVHLAGVIGVADAPHLRITATLQALGHGGDTGVTVFTDGDRMFRQVLRRAGLADLPICDSA